MIDALLSVRVVSTHGKLEGEKSSPFRLRWFVRLECPNLWPITALYWNWSCITRVWLDLQLFSKHFCRNSCVTENCSSALRAHISRVLWKCGCSIAKLNSTLMLSLPEILVVKHP